MLLFDSSTRAEADTFPGNNDTRVADSSVHTYCYGASWTTDPTAGWWGMNRLDVTTDMSDVQQSCSTHVDVWFSEANLSGGLRGTRTCAIEINADICNRSDVTLDFPQLQIGSNDYEDIRKTVVHEIGHSVGLNHGIAAMKSGEVAGTSLGLRSFSYHDKIHINAEY